MDANYVVVLNLTLAAFGGSLSFQYFPLNFLSQAGLVELENHKNHLQKEKEKLEVEIRDMENYCKELVGDGAVGKVLEQFDGMEDFLRGAYSKVLVSHPQGTFSYRKIANDILKKWRILLGISRYNLKFDL